jgi:hypothetical protein
MYFIVSNSRVVADSLSDVVGIRIAAGQAVASTSTAVIMRRCEAAESNKLVISANSAAPRESTYEERRVNLTLRSTGLMRSTAMTFPDPSRWKRSVCAPR